jgi:hypothetical protein
VGEIEKPSYYAVIPANVRYSDIPANAKLLYGEITALCQQEGFCWASDTHFKDLYGVSRKTANGWVKMLEKKGFIKVETERSPKGTLRKLYLVGLHPSNEKVTRVSQKGYTGSNEKVTQVLQVNNTSNISTNVDRLPAYGKPEINDLFEYWTLTTGYPISSKVQMNRNAANNLFKKHGDKGVRKLIDGVNMAQQDKFAPRIGDFVDLQANLNKLLAWGKNNKAKNMEVIS